MKLLLDTHVLLWAAAEPRKLSKKARALLSGAEADLYFSAVSLWEIAIKNALERPDFHVDPGALRRASLDNGRLELPMTGAHAVAVAALPPIHKDPFDRALVAQASFEAMILVTADPVVADYPGSIILV